MEDTGSYVECALKTVKKYGACSSSVWPNDVTPWNKKPSEEAFANGLKGKEIKKWYIINNFKQLKQALVSGYPVAGAVAWCFKSIDENAVLDVPTAKEARKCLEGHAIVFTGYDDEKQLVEFRNSWGPTWGDNGYGYIPYEAFKRVAWYDDMYAVTK